MRGLAKGEMLFFTLSELSLLKTALGISISPLITNVSGTFSPAAFMGIFLIFLMFSVTSSPIVPSPLVRALFKIPLS